MNVRAKLPQRATRTAPILVLILPSILLLLGQMAVAQLARTPLDSLAPYFYYRLTPQSLGEGVALAVTAEGALVLVDSGDGLAQAWKLTNVPIELSPDEGIFDDTEYRLTSWALGESLSLSFGDSGVAQLQRSNAFHEQSWLIDTTTDGGMILSVFDERARGYLSLAIDVEGGVTLVPGRGSGEVWTAIRTAPILGSFQGVWEEVPVTRTAQTEPRFFLVDRRDDHLIVLDISNDYKPEVVAQGDLDPYEPRVVTLNFLDGGALSATLLTPNHISWPDGTLWERR